MFEDPDFDTSDDSSALLVPLQLHGDRLYLSARRLGPGVDEQEVSARMPTIDDVIGGLTALARGAAGRLRETDASRITIEFGCEFAIESGTLVAIIGKASGKSAFKVGLEWSAPTDPR